MRSKKNLNPEKRMSNTNLSLARKQEIENLCQPLIEKFKKKYITENPNEENSYLIDVFIEWRENFIYFLAKYQTGTNAIIEQKFEKCFVRLEYMESGNCNVAYSKDALEWFTIIYNLQLELCLEMIEGVRSFHPKP